MLDRLKFQYTNRKIRDRSIVLLVVGTLLLMPPVGAVSLIDGNIAGVPVPLLYIFTVWIVLIAGTAVLARLLGADESSRFPEDPGDPEV